MNQRQIIEKWVDAHFDDLTDLLRRLIQARTENPPGGETAAANVLEDFFKRNGIPTEKAESQPNRANIMATVGSGGKTLAIPGHLDTVPAGDGWTVPPFEGVVKDGRMSGRGADDDKGPTAAAVLAAACLNECFQLKGTFIVLGVADEELGSVHGLDFLLKNGLLRADMAIVPDIGGNMKVIDVAEKGLLRAEIISHGKQAHGSTPKQGINAIWNLIALLNRIKAAGVPTVSHPLLSPATMNLGIISGGAAFNIIPGRASATFDFRYLPGQTSAMIREFIEQNIRETTKEVPDAKYELIMGQDLPPSEVSPDSEFVRIVSDTAAELNGRAPELVGIGGATVAKQLITHGMPAIGFSAGGPNQAHMADESIDLNELKQFTKVIALIAARLLGAEERA